MAVEVVEVTSSRGGQDATDRSSRAELVYSVSGTDDLAAARSAALATVPLAFDGLVYKTLSREYLGNGLWEFTASYVEPDKADTNNKIDTDEYVCSFDTSGGTVMRTTSWGTAAYAKSGETAPDFKNAINVVVDGDVRGVDITIPALKISIRKRQPKANITLAYVNAMYQLTGTVNNASFLGFAAGELLILGGLGAGYVLSSPADGGPALPLTTALMSSNSGQGGSQITAVRFLDADASDGEVELAFQAVRPMRVKGSPNDPAIQKLLAYALVTGPNAGIRIQTVNTLAGSPHPEIDAEIRTALLDVVQFDTNPGVRKQALQGLTRFPMDGDIKRALLFVLANDPNEDLRIDAINALLPAESAQGQEDPDVLNILRTRMQYENNNYIRLRTKTALQEVQP